MAAETTAQRAEIATKLLQTIGGILLTVCIGLSSWALKEVYAHEGRLIRVETNAGNMESILREIKDDIREIKNRLPSRLEK